MKTGPKVVACGLVIGIVKKLGIMDKCDLYFIQDLTEFAISQI